MYANNRSQHSRFSRQSNSSGWGNSSRNGRSSFPRQARTIKKLDSNLFVNKAVEDHDDENHLSTLLFADLPLNDKLKRNVLEHGYEKTTFIQEKAIPPLLEGRDVIGIANTGTGKTASFLIPLVNKIYNDKNQRVLILAPTRELAIQIDDELKIFKTGMDLASVLCIGGENMRRQEVALHHSPHFVIGTPGRVKDLVQRRKLNLMMFQNVVLDEVDRMVDIGFIQDIKFFISQLPRKRQSLFFSATVSPSVKDILASFVTDAVTVSVQSQQKINTIDQDIIRVRGGEKKLDMLHDLLAKEEFKKVLVFGRTKWGVEKLSTALIERGFRAAAIHGNKTLGQRKRALDQFKNNDIQILLATDVASRGLDIDDVTHVINYDAPESAEDYAHRIGRTGRAGKKGIAITFVE